MYILVSVDYLFHGLTFLRCNIFSNLRFRFSISVLSVVVVALVGELSWELVLAIFAGKFVALVFVRVNDVFVGISVFFF